MSAIISVIGLLVSSTGAASLRKVLFQIKAVGVGGIVHAYEKPYFTAWESTLALCVCLPIYWIGLLLWKRHEVTKPEAEQPLLGDETRGAATEAAQVGTESTSTKLKHLAGLSVPGLLNVASIAMQGVGLQFITATLAIMLSGSCIIFTAALSVLLLKCRLNVYHISGITLTLVGVGIVSAANLIGTHPVGDKGFGGLWVGSGLLSSSGGDALFGIGMTLLSALFLAGRLVAEEVALEGTNLHSFEVLGYEGIWGTLAATLLIYPFAWFVPGHDPGGKLENVVDSLVMLKDPTLSIINVLFFLSVVGLNVFGLFVTSRLGSVFRAVLLTSRTASVWALNLVLFYAHVGDGQVGEPWRSPASWIQLAGFCLLLLGMIIYAQGSSNIAMLLASSKTATSSQDTSRPPSGRVAVTRLRPYTSLYIPNVPQRMSAHPNLQASTSLPSNTGPVWPLARNNLMTHSLPNNFGRVGTPRTPQGDIEEGAASVPGLALPAGHDFPQGGSPSSIRSGTFFLQSLTARSSWLVDRPVWTNTPHDVQRGSSTDEPSPGGVGDNLRTDPSFDLPADNRTAVSAVFREVPERSAFSESDAPAPGSFTFPIEVDSPREDGDLPSRATAAGLKTVDSRAPPGAPPKPAPSATQGDPPKPVLGNSPAADVLLDYQQQQQEKAKSQKLPSFAEDIAGESETEPQAPADSSLPQADSSTSPPNQPTELTNQRSASTDSAIDDSSWVKVSLPGDTPEGVKLLLTPSPDSKASEAETDSASKETPASQQASSSAQPNEEALKADKHGAKDTQGGAEPGTGIDSASDESSKSRTSLQGPASEHPKIAPGTPDQPQEARKSVDRDTENLGGLTKAPESGAESPHQPKQAAEGSRTPPGKPSQPLTPGAVIAALCVSSAARSRASSPEQSSKTSPVVANPRPTDKLASLKDEDTVKSTPSPAKSILGSSGERSDLSSRSSGSKHVFGQSPTPEVLQNRRSMGRAERQPLAALHEDELSEEDEESTEKKSEPGEVDEAERILFDDAASNDDRQPNEDIWATVDSHKVMFDDFSDSELSFTFSDPENPGIRKSSDWRSSSSRQDSRLLQDVEPELWSSPGGSALESEKQK